MSWEGYFFRAVGTGEKFPLKYIDYGSYTSTPNQREEIKAYRDENTRDLVRITAKGKKSVFSFKTRANLHLADKIAILKFFTDAESDKEQRKIDLKFWDDENNIYKTGTFYRPDLKFPILYVTDTDIIYKSLTLEFIEY